MNLEILYYPDPRLREVSTPVADIDSIREYLPGMFEIMYRTRGIGLAAPQVGIQRRFFVANLTAKKDQSGEEQVFINPVILEREGEVREPEGCLSLPGMDPLIRRAEKVVVEVTDLDGERQEFDATGLYAKLFQHEVDHLDGIIILDKMTAADRKQWAPLLRELEEDFQNKVKRDRKPTVAGL